LRSLRNIHLLICAVLAWGVTLCPAHEEAVIVVGRSGAGQLKAHLDFEQPVELPPSIFPGISGYAAADLSSFHSADFDEPANDFYQLSPAVNLRFVLLAKDPGVEVWNDTGSGYMQTNETFFIGQAPFDTHPIWNIVSGTPGNTYSLTLKLRDLNGVYSDSALFILSFTPPTSFEININQTVAGNATLSWSTNAVDWELQSVVSLAVTNWSAITNAPGIVGTNFSLNIATSDEQRFFRLRKQ
jgi:hypothetical protein